ncbi:DUF6625 family protein [Sporocytophaga myxococcoides]|uniref:DUF6625 family protein n=1 Tax=Sporocytophaga myxococcoides TaxID=153721 RepID=UPI0004098323|nr:DUF6625 family protein [Sporocytophaga myxococcoides]
MKIGLVACFIGDLPGYYPYFLLTANNNPSIDFFIINDQLTENKHDKNIHFVKMNLKDIEDKVSLKLGRTFTIHNSWKLNDYKPSIGLVFEDLLKEFDYWGWCDLDIIWGNLTNFLSEEKLKNIDVFSTKENWTAGHFTLFRNDRKINQLFLQNPQVYDMLNSEIYYAFEECCHRWDGKFRLIDELVSEGKMVSMFDIVQNAMHNGSISAKFGEEIREYPDKINYAYSNGKLIDLSDGKELMYYHLITVKKIWRFFIPLLKPGTEELYISPFGIRSNFDSGFLGKGIWFYRRLRYCIKGIKKSFVREGVLSILKRKVGFGE